LSKFVNSDEFCQPGFNVMDQLGSLCHD